MPTTTTATRGTGESARNAIADEFHAAAALFVLQSACISRISHDALPAVPRHSGSPVDTLLDTCETLSADDPLASIAVADLRAFFTPTALRQRRIILNDDGIARCTHALQHAAERGNHAAFETLLRRGLNFLVEPLLAA